MNAAFAWTHPISGEQFAMRFSSDEMVTTYADKGTENIAQVTLGIEEVYIGTGSLTISLHVDPSLT